MGRQPPGAQTLRRIGFRPRRCSSNAQTSTGTAVSEPWSSLTRAWSFPKKLPSAPKRYHPLGAFLWPQAERRSAKVFLRNSHRHRSATSLWGRFYGHRRNCGPRRFFKPRLLVQARLGIGGPRQLTRQVEATQVFDTALGRHGATNPPGDPVRHLAPGPQPAVRRRLADHVAQLLHLGLVEQRGGTGIVQPAVAQTRKAVVVVAPQDLADPDRRIARDLRHELRRMSLAQQPDDLKVTALNAAIRCLVAALQRLGRVMWSEKNSTGHADDVATANGHNTPQSISQAIFLQITEAKASIRKAYEPVEPSDR